MRSTPRAALVIVAVVLLPALAPAREFPAWGDTDWIYGNKRDCCNEAIALAQEESAAACRNTGGVPRPMRGGVQRRGFCKWDTDRDEDGVAIFRCQAEATIPCR